MRQIRVDRLMQLREDNGLHGSQLWADDCVPPVCQILLPAMNRSRLTVGHQENHDSPRFLLPSRANCVLPASPSAPPDTSIKSSPDSPQTDLIRYVAPQFVPLRPLPGGRRSAAARTGVSDCAGFAPN